jgi:hypothetical protein
MFRWIAAEKATFPSACCARRWASRRAGLTRGPAGHEALSRIVTSRYATPFEWRMRTAGAGMAALGFSACCGRAAIVSAKSRHPTDAGRGPARAPKAGCISLSSWSCARGASLAGRSGPTLHTEVTIAALRMAVQCRRPPRGLIHHSGRGIQNASTEYQARLAAYGIRPSMSRRGDCWDNAVVESCLSTLTHEIGIRQWPTRTAAERDVHDSIKIAYTIQFGCIQRSAITRRRPSKPPV